MPARFRIRTKEGQELSFASQEIFAEFVRSGDLAPDDVVYDAETREWSSALTHPVVLQIELEAEEAASGDAPDEAAPAAEPEDGAGAEGDTRGAGLDLDLAPEPTGLTPEEQAAEFVARMEAERESERAFDESPIQGFMMERGAPSVVEDVSPPPPPDPPAGLRPEPTEFRRKPPKRSVSPEPRREPPKAVPARPEKKQKAKKKKPRGAGWKYAPFAIVGAVAVAAVVYFGPDLFAPTAEEDVQPEPVDTAAPPAPAPSIPSTPEAVRARAMERFLTATQTALRGLDPIPTAWLSGAYLATPSDYPEVRAVWDEYLNVVADVRSRDEERYRGAYQRALDDARVEGPERATRLAAATAAFQAMEGPRAAHWDRVVALAQAALRAHDALVGAEGTIAYQPATGPALSGDPVIEAVGRNAEAQGFLNDVLDMILAELQGEGGAGELGNVREWVWDGFLDAVTS